MFDDASDATAKDETIESHAIDEEERVRDFDAIFASADFGDYQIPSEIGSHAPDEDEYERLFLSTCDVLASLEDLQDRFLSKIGVNRSSLEEDKVQQYITDYCSKARDDDALSACMVVIDLTVPDQARHDFTVAERDLRDQDLRDQDPDRHDYTVAERDLQEQDLQDLHRDRHDPIVHERDLQIL